MKAQWENLIMSSLMLYIDHRVCKDGEGFTNYTGKFYKTKAQFNQFHSYSLPYKQIISDTSVTNATVMQGINIDGNFKTIGEEGFQGILHHKGTLLFDQSHDSSEITGSFAVKEYNIYITNKAEEDLLFKTAKQINPKLPQTEEGLDPNTEAYPAIFLKNMGGTMEPIGFGRIEDTISYVRAVILSNSAFSLDAVCGLLKKSAKLKLPILGDLPFNAIGAYSGVSYDYESMAATPLNHGMIWNVSISKIMPQTGSMGQLNLDVFAAFADFEIRSFGSEI